MSSWVHLIPASSSFSADCRAAIRSERTRWFRRSTSLRAFGSSAVRKARSSSSGSPACFGRRIDATRYRSSRVYRRRPPVTRAGESRPTDSQCRSTWVGRPKWPATWPIVSELDFMSTLSPSMARMSTLLSLLDAVEMRPDAIALRARSYELLGPVAGRTVVDVGCGGGRADAELAERGAHAVGVDVAPEMIDAARERWPDAESHVGDACSLPLETGTAAGYRADKVLHALDDPVRAVAEARRVLAPGGRAVLLGQDWDTIVIDSDDPDTTRRL